MIKLWTAIKIVLEQIPRAWLVSFGIGLATSTLPGLWLTKFVTNTAAKWAYNQGKSEGRRECEEGKKEPEREREGRRWRLFTPEEQDVGYMTGLFLDPCVEVVEEGETLEAPR